MNREPESADVEIISVESTKLITLFIEGFLGKKGTLNFTSALILSGVPDVTHNVESGELGVIVNGCTLGVAVAAEVRAMLGSRERPSRGSGGAMSTAFREAVELIY
ncbi:unnamed protein product [Ilex paraguariensis]|uniref:Uncharacterized protein n=1 Tax=Ilex paraguariensis TaxID=185542 RepID=A0ABC8R591_9AQUA